MLSPAFLKPAAAIGRGGSPPASVWPVAALRSGPKTVVKSTSAFGCFGTNR